MSRLVMRAPRAQADLPTSPYDRWLSPDGDETAQFFRLPDGFLVRFPDQADFRIDAESLIVAGTPAAQEMVEQAQILFHNAIEPMLGNYNGQLHMHGSAVRLHKKALGFLGVSRSGKTTLAAGFARSGHPFLTEDVLTLEYLAPGFSVRPSRPELRLFGDSSAHLLDWPEPVESDEKRSVAASGTLPHCTKASPLAALFLLGPGAAADTRIEPLGKGEAFTRLIRQSFILDVEDKPRLRAHFDRIARLAEAVDCYALDYPRRYADLPRTIDAIENQVARRRGDGNG